MHLSACECEGTGKVTNSTLELGSKGFMRGNELNWLVTTRRSRYIPFGNNDCTRQDTGRFRSGSGIAQPCQGVCDRYPRPR